MPPKAKGAGKLISVGLQTTSAKIGVSQSRSRMRIFRGSWQSLASGLKEKGRWGKGERRRLRAASWTSKPRGWAAGNLVPCLCSGSRKLKVWAGVPSIPPQCCQARGPRYSLHRNSGPRRVFQVGSTFYKGPLGSFSHIIICTKVYFETVRRDMMVRVLKIWEGQTSEQNLPKDASSFSDRILGDLLHLGGDIRAEWAEESYSQGASSQIEETGMK